MKRSKPVTAKKSHLGVVLRCAIMAALGYPIYPSAQTTVPSIELPTEEAIEQGRNRGVETWEGTLFGQDSYKPGSYAQIEVVPNPGFEFDRWEGDNIANPAEAKTFVTMEEHVSIKPFYNRIWNVIAAPDNKQAGEVSGSGDYPDGTEVTLSVKPNDGFKFLGWEGKGIREEEKENLETTVVADGDHDIVARFENENQDQNQDQNEDNQDQNDDQQDQDQNQDSSDQNEDQQDPNESPEDQENTEEPQDPEQEEPQEPEGGEDEQDPGSEEEQPQDPNQEDQAPGEEAPSPEMPMPGQMTPEEAARLLEAMEGDEKKLPLFIVNPQDQKKDNKKDW